MSFIVLESSPQYKIAEVNTLIIIHTHIVYNYFMTACHKQHAMKKKIKQKKVFNLTIQEMFLSVTRLTVCQEKTILTALTTKI